MKALIIGAGIAGPVTAMALKKAGIDPIVFEAHDRSAEGVGAFLTVAVNGVLALRAIDIEPGALDGGFATPRFAMHLSNGDVIGELANGPVLPDGTVSLTLKRSALYGAMKHESERRGIPMCYGKRLVDVRRLVEGGVVASFSDGTTAEGDVLVGADGLKSTVRTLIDPSAPRAQFVGLLNFGGYARGVQIPGPPGTFHMVFGKRSFFAYILNPNGEVWWFANPWRDKEPSPGELAAKTSEGWRAELLRLFSDDASPAVELIKRTEELTGGWAAYDFARVPIWHRDRMIIVGDAAHAASPSSGQGASMAMEDAVVLAKCLRDEASIEAAFSTYEQLRRARVERIVEQGRRNGTGKSPGALGRAVRDLMLRMMMRYLEWKGAELNRWIYDYRLDWESPLAPRRAA